MSETVLITGAFGYLGGRISHFLTQNENLKLRLGTRRSIKKPPEYAKKSTIVQLNMSSESNLNAACKGVEYIVHLAAPNEIESASDPEAALLNTGVGTLKLIEAAERSGVNKIIYFSTAHVYGAPLIGHITEENVPRPAHPYAIAHRLAEDFILQAHDQKKITGIVVRVSNGFGAPVNPDITRWTLLVNDLCKQAVTTGQLVLRSTGIQRRDFITIADICSAVSHLLYLPTQKCENGLFNLGGDCSLMIIEMVESIAARCKEVLHFTPQIIRSQPQISEKSVPLEYSITKLKRSGFILTNNMNNEIDSTLKMCKQYFGDAN